MARAAAEWLFQTTQKVHLWLSGDVKELLSGDVDAFPRVAAARVQFLQDIFHWRPPR